MIPTNTTFLFESLQLIEVSALVRGLNCKHILLLHTEEMKPRKLCRISYQTMPLLSFIAVCTIFIPCSICQHTTNEHIESSLLLFHKNQVKPPPKRGRLILLYHHYLWYITIYRQLTIPFLNPHLLQDCRGE